MSDIPTLVDLGEALAALDQVNPLRLAGRVSEVTGLLIRANVPGIRVGELVWIDSTPPGAPPPMLPGASPEGAGRVQAEVVGFRGDDVVLMPLGEAVGIGPDSMVTPTGRPLTIKVGDGLLGRVLDGLGRAMDGGVPLGEGAGWTEWNVDRPSPDPLTRRRIQRPLALGVRAIDALMTVGEGQRVGLFAGAGVGKSTLLGQIARNTDADVNVICLCGERGREVLDFLDQSLGATGRARSVVVCATSDAPSLVRLKSTFVATAIAEWFRERGQRVLFMMDSLTRFARAQREVGLAAGEPAVRQGYPPSVFALLPRLLERTGNSAAGSITALYTVLVAGGDMEEPIADEVRGILDGHIVLSRAIADRNQWPAIDVLPSLSRLMTAVADRPHQAAAARLRGIMAAYERQRDLIMLGAYQRGSDPRTDEAIARIDGIAAFLRQEIQESAPFEETRRRLLALAT
ncbi:MAG: synthase in type secretion protein [Myxococcales bacterium]|jgi:type III secretion protein N (ATPase)|nr:synthase in type secretion protein [Myxococcales bacterium]